MSVSYYINEAYLRSACDKGERQCRKHNRQHARNSHSNKFAGRVVVEHWLNLTRQIRFPTMKPAIVAKCHTVRTRTKFTTAHRGIQHLQTVAPSSLCRKRRGKEQQSAAPEKSTHASCAEPECKPTSKIGVQSSRRSRANPVVFRGGSRDARVVAVCNQHHLTGCL